MFATSFLLLVVFIICFEYMQLLCNFHTLNTHEQHYFLFLYLLCFPLLLSYSLLFIFLVVKISQSSEAFGVAFGYSGTLCTHGRRFIFFCFGLLTWKVASLLVGTNFAPRS